MSVAPPAAADPHDITRGELVAALRTRRITLVDVLSPESFVLTRWPERGVADGLHEASLFDGLDEG